MKVVLRLCFNLFIMYSIMHKHFQNQINAMTLASFILVMMSFVMIMIIVEIPVITIHYHDGTKIIFRTVALLYITIIMITITLSDYDHNICECLYSFFHRLAGSNEFHAAGIKVFSTFPFSLSFNFYSVEKECRKERYSFIVDVNMYD